MRKPGEIKRAPRVELSILATVVDSERHLVPVTIIDISKEGCRMKTDGTLMISEFVDIHVEGGDIHRAQIRWALGNEAGAVFVDPVVLPEEEGAPAL